jgi:hypothetical protein
LLFDKRDIPSLLQEKESKKKRRIFVGKLGGRKKPSY